MHPFLTGLQVNKRVDEEKYEYLMKLPVVLKRGGDFGKKSRIGMNEYAGVVKLVDTLDLGSSAERCVGSSPSTRTKTELRCDFDRTFSIYR